MKKSTLILALMLAPMLLLDAGGREKPQDKNAVQDTTLYGYISDSICGAKGATSSHYECMMQCLAKGAKPVIISEPDNAVVNIDNPQAIVGHEGHRVSVTGDILTNESFHIRSLRIL